MCLCGSAFQKCFQTYLKIRKIVIHAHCIDNNYLQTFLKSLWLSGYRIHD